MRNKARLAWLAGVALATLGYGIAQGPLAQAADSNVKLWSFIDPKGEGARSAALQEVLTDFEKGGAKVDTSVVEWDQIAPTLMRAAQAGQVPDLAVIYSPNLPSLIAAGSLQPLDDCLGKIWSEADRKDAILLPVAQSGGKVYGVPYELRVFGFYYRDDLLKKASLKEPDSFDALLTTAKQASQPGQSPLGMSFNAGGGSVEAIEWFVPMVIGMNGPVLKPDGSADFDNPQVIDLLGRIKAAVDGGVLPKDVMLSTTDQVEQLAQSGRTVFIAEGSQEASSFKETATNGAVWSFMPPPGLQAGTTSPAALNGWNLVIPKGAKNVDGACALIKTWTSPEIQRDQAVKAGYMPMRASLAGDPAFQAPDSAYMGRLIKYAGDNPLKFEWPANTDLLNEVLSQMIEKVATGQASAEDAAKAAAQSYDSRRQ